MRCPYCAEEIKDEASVCRFCNRDVVSDPCKICVSKGKTVALIPSEIKENKSFTTVFIVFAVIFTLLSFLFDIVGGLIVMAICLVIVFLLPKRIVHVLKCPSCGGVRDPRFIK